jgi:hypothetical protein
LLLVSSNVLDAVKKIPATAAYRTTVEQWFNFITKTAQNHTDIKKIEDEIGLGQIEEVIEMAKDELELVQYYYDNKGWLLVEQAQKEGDAIVEGIQSLLTYILTHLLTYLLILDMADSIYFTTPEMKPPAAAAPQTPPTPPPSTPANAPPKK